MAREALTGFDPITLRIAVVAFPVALVVIVCSATHVIKKALANAKTLRIRHGTGELELQFQKPPES